MLNIVVLFPKNREHLKNVCVVLKIFLQVCLAYCFFWGVGDGIVLNFKIEKKNNENRGLKNIWLCQFERGIQSPERKHHWAELQQARVRNWWVENPLLKYVLIYPCY